MDITRFNRIKEKYQYYASWAVWAEGALPMQNVGDLSVLEVEILNMNRFWQNLVNAAFKSKQSPQAYIRYI